MKLSPPRVVSTTASTSQHDNAKRTHVAHVYYRMRGSIIAGRLYTIEQRYLDALVAKSLSFERQRHV